MGLVRSGRNPLSERIAARCFVILLLFLAADNESHFSKADLLPYPEHRRRHESAIDEGAVAAPEVADDQLSSR
jgi:hypothetical protein